MLTDHSKSRADIENYQLILFLAFWFVIFVSKIILAFVCPFPLLVDREMLFRSFDKWWQEAIISLTLSNVEVFPSNKDQWFFWDTAFLEWTGLIDKTGCSDVVVVVALYCSAHSSIIAQNEEREVYSNLYFTMILVI